MNILTGLHKKDQGTIKIDGKERVFDNPKEAEENGVAFIHQELNIWPELTVLENLFINKEPVTSFGLIHTKKMNAIANEQFKKLAISIPLQQEAGNALLGSSK